MKKLLCAVAVLCFATAAFALPEIATLKPLMSFSEVKKQLTSNNWQVKEVGKSDRLVRLMAVIQGTDRVTLGGTPIAVPALLFLREADERDDDARLFGYKSYSLFQSPEVALHSPTFLEVKKWLSTHAKEVPNKEGVFSNGIFTWSLAVGENKDKKGLMILEAAPEQSFLDQARR